MDHCPLPIDLIVESMQLYLVDLYEDPDVDLVVESLVDRLVDLLVESVDSTEISLE